MTTDILDQKYARRFEMFDADHNGHVDLADFEQLAERLVTGLGCAPDSPRAQRVAEGYRNLWSSLSQAIDTDGDGRLTREEFVGGMRRVAGDRAGFRQLIEPLARLNLELCDADGDGGLSRAEFADLLRLFNAASPADAEEIFDSLDTSGDGQLGLAEILDALCDFYTSTDPNVPGNRLFGAF